MLAARSAYLVSPHRFLMKRNNYEPYSIVHLFHSLVNFFLIKDRVGLQTMKFLIMQYFSIFPSLCLTAEYSFPTRPQTHLRSSYTRASLSARD